MRNRLADTICIITEWFQVLRRNVPQNTTLEVISSTNATNWSLILLDQAIRKAISDHELSS